MAAAEEDVSDSWRPLPHVPSARINRQRLIHSAAVAAAAGCGSPLLRAAAYASGLPTSGPRSARSVDSWPAIPVWPTWGGGRVVPISPDPSIADPFLLLAHHKHSFTPGDPLRGPFRAVGGALGLPYVGDEGFKMHPHRGIDILTYVLDGSDGFRHRDSLGGQAVYRGGAAQFMRSGRGALHEEMWETSPDRTTRIELFQLWVNLPSRLKMQEPAIRYLGRDWGADFVEIEEEGGTRVRTALDSSLLDRAVAGSGKLAAQRPAVTVEHITLPPGGRWRRSVPPSRTAMLYVRSGAARLGHGAVLDPLVPAGSTAFFERDGDHVSLANAGAPSEACDALLLTGEPLREPIALGGPIVMNTEAEVRRAYRELEQGTFLA